MIRDDRMLLSRRGALALGAGVALAPLVAGTLVAGPASAAGLSSAGLSSAAPMSYVYDIRPAKIADGVWVIPGLQEKITAKNGGAIANVVIFDTKDGAVVIDTGPSHRYGVQLAAAVELLTGKPVARVYITHIHSDHALGATAFPAETLYGPAGLAADLKLRGNDITNAMYRIAGDWMRDTNVPDLKNVATAGVSDIGERRFHALPLSGHTADDLVLYEERSGLLLTGDLVFLDRAPTTPDAILPAWRSSLAKLADIPHAKLVPGHGPVEPGHRGIEQTRRWLDFVDGAITTHFNDGLDEIEMMGSAIPDWTDEYAVARYEYQRSVMHLLPRHESTQLPIVS